MGWILLLILGLPSFPIQDPRPIRESLLNAIEHPTEKGLEKCLDDCLSLENGGVRILRTAWIRCEKSLQNHRELLSHWEEEMEKHDDTKPGSKGGNAFEFLKSREKRNETLGTIALLELYQGRILRGFLTRIQASEEKDLVRSLKEGPPIIRAYSALALGKTDRELSRSALLKAVKRERSPLVRVALLDALAGDREAVPTFEKNLMHGHWQVQISSAQALARTKNRASAGVLIKTLPKVSGRIAHEYNEALKAITGVDKRGNAASWRAWWEENGETFLEGTYIPSIGERVEDKGKSTFYGIRIQSKRVLFLLDVSPSMKRSTTWLPDDPVGRQELKGDRLIDVAMYELQKIIRTLPHDTVFNVMLFWNDRKLALKKPGRGRGDLQTALEFVGGIALQDGTDHWAALCTAFEMYGEATPKGNLPRIDFDTIFLISDGVPSQGLRDPDLLLERLADLNRFRKIAIHTIALETGGTGSRFLTQIAEVTGGRYAKR